MAVSAVVHKGGTCASRCDVDDGSSCYCDPNCMTLDDCCDDFVAECTEEVIAPFWSVLTFSTFH